MKQEEHQGWTNYETWLVSLWLDNEQGSYDYWRAEAARQRHISYECPQVRDGIWSVGDAAKFNLADQLKEEIGDTSRVPAPDLYGDLLGAALSEVNWHEIAEHYLSELSDQGEEPMPVISAYTRREAIADGVLIDVTDTAHEAGIRHPTAVTAGVWGRYVSVPKAVAWQDESGRLWDVIWMLRHAAAKANGESELTFEVYVQNDQRPPQPVRLKAVCGPGDEGEPVMTVMLPEED